MTKIEISIRGAKDFPNETYAGLQERNIYPIQLQLEECIIIESGTANGRTQICFLLTDEKGKYFISQVTADMIQYGLMAAIKGTNERWKVPPRP